MSITFFERNGRIHFDYHEQVYETKGEYVGRAFRSYSTEGCVPEVIVAQGTEAVRDWTRRYVDTVIATQKERDKKFDELRRSVDVPLETIYEKFFLRGRVHYSQEKDDLVIVLESPVAGESPFRYGRGFGASMSGHKVWESNWEEKLVFTQGALANARDVLVRIYQDHFNAPIIQMVNRLNRP